MVRYPETSLAVYYAQKGHSTRIFRCFIFNSKDLFRVFFFQLYFDMDKLGKLR